MVNDETFPRIRTTVLMTFSARHEEKLSPIKQESVSIIIKDGKTGEVRYDSSLQEVSHVG